LQRRPTVFHRSSPHWSFPHWSLPHWSLVIRRTIVPFAAAAAIVAALIGYGLRNFPQGSEPLTVARQPTPPTSPPRSPSLTPSPKSLPSVKGCPKKWQNDPDSDEIGATTAAVPSHAPSGAAPDDADGAPPRTTDASPSPLIPRPFFFARTDVESAPVTCRATCYGATCP
jgi:hypothetical protein